MRSLAFHIRTDTSSEAIEKYSSFTPVDVVKTSIGTKHAYGSSACYC